MKDGVHNGLDQLSGIKNCVLKVVTDAHFVIKSRYGCTFCSKEQILMHI